MFSGLLSHSAAPAADFSRLQRASITFRDVAKRYGDHQVLNAINLQVEPGEVVAILGPSGSGKSTLIRLINQLESLSGGEILIDGKPTSRLSGSALRQLRSRVGFVFQQFNLYAHLTAQENITLALERVHGWGKARLRSGRWRCCARSDWKKKRSRCRRSSPAASSSGWPSPAPWPPRRRLSCSMSPPRRSTRR
jgi:polar amino acid transport system ATP-binding protein